MQTDGPAVQHVSCDDNENMTISRTDPFMRRIQHGPFGGFGGYGLEVRGSRLFLLGLGNSLGDRLELARGEIQQGAGLVFGLGAVVGLSALAFGFLFGWLAR